MNSSAPHPGQLPRLPLSVVIVCKNAASTIGMTLERVAPFAGEIVALDSGSTDGTLDLLAHHGARIERIAWMGHVKTKQAALQAASLPWVLSLDADESPEPELAADIARVIQRDDPRFDGYKLNRKVWYAGRFLHHAWQLEWRLRLVRRGRAAWMGIDPHDKLTLLDAGKEAGFLRGDLRHDSITNFPDFLAKQCHYGRLMASGLHAQGVRGSRWSLLTSPGAAFLKQMVLKHAFLDGWRGWLAAAATATAAAAKHAALLELDGLAQEQRGS